MLFTTLNKFFFLPLVLSFMLLCALRNTPVSYAAVSEIHVAPSGSDANSGTAATPLKTIQKAISLASPGTTILIQPGIYNERVVVNRSGEAGNPITIKAVSAGVIVDGSGAHTQWQKVTTYGGNIYMTDRITEKIGNMTLNNTYLIQLKDGYITESILRNEFVKGPPHKECETCTTYNSWEDIDAVWGYYDGKLYIGFASAINPNTTVKVGTHLGASLTLDGVSHVHIRGLELRNTVFGILLTNNANNNFIENNTITGASYSIGLWNGANKNTLQKNYLTLGYKYSLNPYNKHAEFLWDQFKARGTGDKEGVDCYKGGAGNIIAYNTIREHFGGIYTGRGGQSYCGEIKVFGNQLEYILDDGLEPEALVTNSEWYNNIVRYAKQGIRIKEPVGGPLYVYNNIFIHSQNRGIYHVASGTATVYVYHNTVVHSPTAGLVATTLADTSGNLSNSLYVNNVFIATKFGQKGNTQSSVIFEKNGVIVEVSPPSFSSTNKVLVENNLTQKYPESTTQVSSLKEIGIDISKSFNISGKQYPALKGFSPQYYSGQSPNPGAYQTIQPSSQITIQPTGTTTRMFSVNILLHGIGKGGDNVNPLSEGNTNPKRTQRSVLFELLNEQNQIVASKNGTVAYVAATGDFRGLISLDNIPSGVYIGRVKVSQYLRKNFPGIISLSSNTQIDLPKIALMSGDVTDDNKISILDYNVILDCFSDLSPARNCTDPNKKAMSDITDDGNVNQFDYNLFLRELSVQTGE